MMTPSLLYVFDIDERIIGLKAAGCSYVLMIVIFQPLEFPLQCNLEVSLMES